MKKYLPILIVILGTFGNLSANPVGENVISGAVTFDRSPNQLLIQQSTDTAVIHWNDFSINTNELTQFIQPGSGSSVLNRVVTGNPSALLGTLQSNGKVFLINPNGILVGAGAQINCGSFTASTLDISNQDFLNGVNHFTGDSMAGVQNLGKITTTSGDLILIGRNLSNQGEMVSAGKIGMYAGGDVVIPQGDKPSVVLPGTILNEGTLTALEVELRASGENPYALAINNTGKIKATGFVRGEGGNVSLIANRGRVKSSGEIDASGSRKGGRVEVTGDQVGIAGTIRANGSDQGGAIHIGGDWQGKGNLKNAKQVKVTPDAVIEAKGSRGEIVIWSDRTTEFYGAASIAGGGGKMEISGKENLNFQGEVDLGGTGSLLLDPNNIQIATANPGGAYVASAISTDLDQFSDNAAQDSWLTPTQLLTLLSSGDVTLQSNTDILFANAVDASGSLYSGRSLSLYAGRRVNFSANADLTLNGGNFYAKYNDENALGANRTAGEAYFQTINGADITTNGGNITVVRGSYNDTGNNWGGVVIGNSGASILNSGSGNISITGAVGSTTNIQGIRMDNGSSLMTNTGSISLTGTGKGGTASAQGIVLLLSSAISSQSGNVTLNGSGGSGGTNSNHGIYITGLGGGISTVSGNIALNGTGNGTTTNNYGVGIDVNSIVQATGSGNISITGTGAAGTSSNIGLLVNSSAQVKVFSGNLTLNGSGGNGSAGNNYGIQISSSSAVRSSGGGAISISGTGGQTLNTLTQIGVFLDASAVATTSGDLTINGYGGSGGVSTNDWGIYVSNSSSVSSSASGNIILNGYAATGSATGGTSANIGFFATTSGTVLSTGSGNITVNGVGRGTTNDNYGIDLTGSGNIRSIGTGTITLNGTGGNGTVSNYGILVNGTTAGTQVASTTGDIVMRGTGGGSGVNGFGIWLLNDGDVLSNGSANITLIGQGATTNQGIQISGAATNLGSASSTGDITLKAGTATGTDSIVLTSGSIATGGRVNFAPINASDTIGLSGGTGLFDLSAADLANVSQASKGIRIGSADQTGLITATGGSYSQGITLWAGGANAAGVLVSSAMTAGSGKDIVVVTPNGHFTNAVGPSVFNTSNGGKWLVYMDNEGDFNRNGLVESFQGWGITYPTAPLKTGNGFMILNTPYSGAYRIFAVNQDKAIFGSHVVLNVSGLPRFFEVGTDRDLGEDFSRDPFFLPDSAGLIHTKGFPEEASPFIYSQTEWSRESSPSILFSSYQLHL